MSSHDEQTKQPAGEKQDQQQEARPQYQPPQITKMSEEDVLKSFQVTGAAASWWGM